MGLIYKVTCLSNGKIYIGQTRQSLEDRKGVHISKSLNHRDNYRFHNAIRKYGKENFLWEIVENNIDSQNLLNEREIYWIAYYNSQNPDVGYNMTPGGESSEPLDRWRGEHPEEVSKQARIGWEKMRAILEANPEKDAERQRKAAEGARRFAKEHPDKKREISYQIYLNHKEQQDKQMEEFHRQQSKPVKCLETGKVYPSVSEASRQTGISQGNISSCCLGVRKSAGKGKNKEKLHWIYLPKESLSPEEVMKLG